MTLRLYGFWRSIASFRVRVALKLKDLPFKEVSVDILSGDQFSSDYDAVNAERVVPTLVHGEHRLFQSLAIIEYLDDLMPEPRLLPSDPADRAYARSLALVTVADAHPLVTPRVRNHLIGMFGANAKAVEDWARHWTIEGLATYERLLDRRPPAPFALGLAGQIVGAHFLKLDLTRFPRVAGLADQCFALPAFATSHPFQQPGYKTTETS